MKKKNKETLMSRTAVTVWALNNQHEKNHIVFILYKHIL